MKYCGLVIDEAVFAPTKINKRLEWDLREECLSPEGIEYHRLKLINERYQCVDMLNVNVSDLLLMLDGLRGLRADTEVKKLTERIDFLVGGVSEIIKRRTKEEGCLATTEK